MDKRTEREPIEVSEIELLVRQSDEDVALFDPARIADVLIRETRLAPDLARQISFEVKDQIERCSIRSLTSSLIRELVDAKLLEYGLIGTHRAHARLGVPIFDVDRVIQGASRGATSAHGPEGTSLILAEAIKRDYAMLAVFSDTVASAHYSGDIQIEHLGEIDRPGRLISSIDLIKRHGLILPGGFAGSKPARRAEVLAAHLVTYTAALQGYFSAPAVWDSVNFAFAPFIAEHSERELQQLAQGLVFELSAPAIARGGQSVSCDLHLDIEAPSYLATRAALGLGGEKLKATYVDYSGPARGFLRAMCGVLLEGDAEGMPFAEPRLIVHITRRTLEEPELRVLVDLACEVSLKRGGVTFAFDREVERQDAEFSMRYGIADEKQLHVDETWQWRTAFFSSTAINLPRIGYRAEGDRVKVFELISELLELAAQASLEKRVFLEKLLARGEQGSLALLAKRLDSEAFLPLNRAMHAICPIGLAELAEAVFGKPLDSSKESQEFAAHIVAHLEKDLLRLSAKHKVKFILAEPSDLTAAHRLARLDLREYGAETVVQIPAGESGENGEYAYYSHGLRLPVSSETGARARQRIEGMISGDRIFGSGDEHWLGRNEIAPEQLTRLIAEVFTDTNLPRITLAPEFTVCLSCRVASQGLSSACPQCGSDRVDELALENDRMSRTSDWPTFKRAQLEHRRRGTTE